MRDEAQVTEPHWQGTQVLISVNFSLFFLFLPVLLVSYPRNHSEIECHVSFSSFLVRVLVLKLKFKSFIHFELIFAYGISSSPQPFWHQGPVLWKTVFRGTGWESDIRGGVGGRAQVLMEGKLPSPAAYLLLCGLVPTRPQTSTDPWSGDWGPLGVS